MSNTKKFSINLNSHIIRSFNTNWLFNNSGELTILDSSETNKGQIYNSIGLLFNNTGTVNLNNIVLNKTLSEDYKIFTDDVLFKLLSGISALEEIWESDYRLPLNEKNYKVYGNNIMTAFTTEGINNSILRIVTMGYPVKRVSLSTEKDNK